MYFGELNFQGNGKVTFTISLRHKLRHLIHLFDIFSKSKQTSHLHGFMGIRTLEQCWKKNSQHQPPKHILSNHFVYVNFFFCGIDYSSNFSIYRT